MAERDRNRRRERSPGGGEHGERRRGAAGGAAARRRKVKREAGGDRHLPLERTNLILFAVALGVIILGFVVLGRGSITLAPILLVLGYCVLVPLAIVYRSRRRTEPTPGPAPGESRGE